MCRFVWNAGSVGQIEVNLQIGGVVSGMPVGRYRSREYVRLPRGYVRRASGFRTFEIISHISEIVE